ncbi:hypothetical protein TNCV_3611111 [Trichonephila clavipes]|nr:hypothetical protein TNCV_3611111 [Trichonephila clavipes]
MYAVWASECVSTKKGCPNLLDTMNMAVSDGFCSGYYGLLCAEERAFKSQQWTLTLVLSYHLLHYSNVCCLG